MTDARPAVLKILREYVEDPDMVVDQIVAEIAKGTLKFPATQWAVRYDTNACKDMQLGVYNEYQLALAMQLQLQGQDHPEAHIVERQIGPWESRG